MTDYKTLKLIATSSPHIRGNETTRSIMLDVIIALCPALLFACFNFGFRALTVTAIHLSEEGEAYEQTDLFAPPPQRQERQEKLEGAMARIRQKYGSDAIVFGAARPEKEEDPLP